MEGRQEAFGPRIGGMCPGALALHGDSHQDQESFYVSCHWKFFPKHADLGWQDLELASSRQLLEDLITTREDKQLAGMGAGDAGTRVWDGLPH